jgi:hypothetical protein
MLSWPPSSMREEYKRHLDEAQKEGGIRAFRDTWNAPFQSEPSGPRAQRRR